MVCLESIVRSMSREKNVYSAVVGALSSGSQVKRVVLFLRSISFLQFFPEAIPFNYFRASFFIFLNNMHIILFFDYSLLHIIS